MAKFEVRQTVRAPPDFVAAWWTDFRPEDAQLGGQMERRRVERLDKDHLHVDTELLVGKHPVRVDGTVTLDGPRSWHIESDVSVRGKPFGKEVVHYRVEEDPGGSVVVGEFRFIGKDLVHHLLFALSRRSARQGRREAFQGFARAIEEELRPSGTSGPQVASRP